MTEDGFIESGCVAPWSTQRISNTLLWFDSNGVQVWPSPTTLHFSELQDFNSWDDVATTEPVSGKVLVALGVAAVVASPRKFSRRGFFGLLGRTR